MKLCVLTIVCVSLVPGAAVAQLSLDDAFAVLEKQAVSEADLVEASDVILAQCMDGDEECIQRLMEIWSGERTRPQSLMLACKKADDAATPIILGAVARMIKSAEEKNDPPGGRLSHRASSFFHEPARVLCERLSDPEPVAMFALEHGFSAGSYPLPVEIMDKHILQALRRRVKHELGGGGSGGLAVSDAAMPRLRVLFRTMYQTHPQSDGAWSALGSLVSFVDTEIIPDLEVILKEPPFSGREWQSYEDLVRMYLLKLHTQGRPDERVTLLEVVAAERERSRVLRYAVCRLAYLRQNRSSIVQALSQNPRKDSFGRDLAVGWLRLVAPDEAPERTVGQGPALGGLEAYDVNLDVLDRDELRESNREAQRHADQWSELDAQEKAIMRSARLAPDFDEAEFRENPEGWKQRHPEFAAQIAEVRAAKKALSDEGPNKYSVRALLDRVASAPLPSD